MKIEVFKNFELVDMIYEFEKLELNKKFRDAGDFSLTLASLDYADSLVENNVILVENQAYIIQDFNKYKNMQNQMRYVVSGKHINSILDRRVLLSKLTINTTQTYEQQMRNIVNANFITASDTNRRIANFTLGSLRGYTQKPTVTSELAEISVRQALTIMSADARLGYEIIYDVDNKRYIFNIIQGRDLTDEVFFSEDFGNILDSEIFKKTSDSINVCYLNNNGSLSSRGSGVGLERKEGIISGDSLGYADEELQRRSDIEMAECQILLTDQFVYKEDWNLGDTVTFIDKSLGFKVEKPVLEITEVYTDRFNIDVVFGDRKPTIFDRLGK